MTVKDKRPPIPRAMKRIIRQKCKFQRGLVIKGSEYLKIEDLTRDFYNRQRLHSSIGYQLPVEFEKSCYLIESGQGYGAEKFKRYRTDRDHLSHFTCGLLPDT